jgi:hypothetical protein
MAGDLLEDKYTGVRKWRCVEVLLRLDFRVAGGFFRGPSPGENVVAGRNYLLYRV